MNVYDFDDTIYNGDSTVDFYLYCLKKNKKVLKYIPKQIKGVFLYIIKRISKEELKEYFFSFLKEINTEKEVNSFWKSHKKHIKKWYLENQREDDVIISASPVFLLKPICEDLNIKNLIATETDPKTGKTIGKNCKGQEKVKKFKEVFKNKKIEKFYSDSKSDTPLAEIAKQAFIVDNDNIYDWKEDKKNKKNYIYNIILLISSISFFILNLSKKNMTHKALIILVFITILTYLLLYIKLGKKSFIKGFINTKISIKILSILSSIGIILYSGQVFLLRFNAISIKSLNIIIKNSQMPTICIILQVLSVPFCLIIYSKIYELIRNVLKKLYKNSSKTEKKIYVLFLILSIIGALFSYYNAKQLYFHKDQKLKYDIIYTSDSPYLIRENAWLNIRNAENDIRQPLFAVYASPFVAPVYTVIYPFIKTKEIVLPIGIEITQVLLLLLGSIALTHTISTKSNKRIIFFILFNSLYSTLLFQLVLEQYNVEFFWLMLFIYAYISSLERKHIYVGAVGSLSTSAVLFPLMYNKNDRVYHKIRKVIKVAIIGFTTLIMAGRADIIINIKAQITNLTRFTGDKITILNKFEQFSHFIKNIFISPKAKIMNNLWKQDSWQIIDIKSISIIGVLLILLCILSYIINRNKKIVKISILWILFSIFVLFIMGWGTQENGLILYSLYFGWAYLILLCELLENILKKLNLKKYTKIIYILIIIFLYSYNLKAIHEMIYSLKNIL